MQCKVYKGFKTTYAPLQMTSISGKALSISAGQCKTTYCILQHHGFVVEESGAELAACSPNPSPIENIWHIIKQKIYQRRSRTLQQLETYIRFKLKKMFQHFRNLGCVKKHTSYSLNSLFSLSIFNYFINII